MLALIRNNINSMPICKKLYDLLGDTYKCLSDNRLTDVVEIAKAGVETCNLLKSNAIEIHNEQLANASYVMSKLFSLYNDYVIYWSQLKEKKYKSSWNNLQDTIDNLILVSKWSSNRCHYHLDTLDMHFKELEKLYPYRLFASSEMVISKTKCSICGKDGLNLDCTHIPGNLYWGEVAYTIVQDFTFEAVALVKHPLDKRCVMEVQGDNRTEEEKFKLLDYFVSNISHPLILFELTEQERIFVKKFEQKLSRNDRCYCGSGLKFKYCCGKEKYIKGIHFVLFPRGTLRLNLPD